MENYTIANHDVAIDARRDGYHWDVTRDGKSVAQGISETHAGAKRRAGLYAVTINNLEGI